MLKFLTRMFSKNASQALPAVDAEAPVETAPVQETAAYELPSDNPEANPVLVVEEADSVRMADVASLNSQLLAPVENHETGLSNGISVRTRAVIDMKNGFTDLAGHIRVLGQRLHAQSMGQTRLIEALTQLPAMLRDMLPNAEEQNKVLAAVKMSLDEQADANRLFVDSLRPLPAFIQAASDLPQVARQQIVALDELTEQLSQSSEEARAQAEQVKVIVETVAEQNKQQAESVEKLAQTQAAAVTKLAMNQAETVEKLASSIEKKSEQQTVTLREALKKSSGEAGEQVKSAVEKLERYQKAQLVQNAKSIKNAEALRLSARKYQVEMLRRQSEQFTRISSDQGRYFARLEEKMQRSQKRTIAIAAASLIFGLAAVTFAVLASTGVIQLPGMDSVPVAEQSDRADLKDMVVGK